MESTMTFKADDHVIRTTGYRFAGVVIAAFHKWDGVLAPGASFWKRHLVAREAERLCNRAVGPSAVPMFSTGVYESSTSYTVASAMPGALFLAGVGFA
jgi:hypothetical protein